MAQSQNQDHSGVQRCRAKDCNSVLIPIVPEHFPKQQELYCPKCHLSYSKFSVKLPKLLPHIAKELRAA